MTRNAAIICVMVCVIILGAIGMILQRTGEGMVKVSDWAINHALEWRDG